MALQKPIEVKNSGVYAEYWRITVIHADFQHESGNLVMAGYLDQNTRAAGKEPIHTISISFDSQGLGFPFDLTDPTTSIATQLYNWLKTHPLFDGAVDV